MIEGIAEFREFYRSRRVIAEGRHSVEALFHSDEEWRSKDASAASSRRPQADLFFSDFFDLIEEAGSVLIASRRTYFDDTRV